MQLWIATRSLVKTGFRGQKRSCTPASIRSRDLYDRADDVLRIDKNPYYGEKYGYDSFNSFNFIVSWSTTDMALQQWLGILPNRRLGLTLYHSSGACFNGKNLTRQFDGCVE